MRTRSAALIAVLVLGGCTEPAAPDPGAQPGGQTPTAPGTDLVYECAGASFDPATFEPGDAEKGAEPQAEALRHLLSLFDAEGMPEHGWTKVADNDKEATFIAGDDTGFFYAIVRRDGQDWKESGWGGCRPRIDIDGGSVVEWSLDPDAPSPGPEDTVIEVVINEIACHSFDDPLDRMREPTVIYETDRVLVALTADPLKGAQTCPGTPPVAYEFELSEPLGDRTLYDAGTYPARAASEHPTSW